MFQEKTQSFIDLLTSPVKIPRRVSLKAMISFTTGVSAALGLAKFVHNAPFRDLKSAYSLLCKDIAYQRDCGDIDIKRLRQAVSSFVSACDRYIDQHFHHKLFAQINNQEDKDIILVAAARKCVLTRKEQAALEYSQIIKFVNSQPSHFSIDNCMRFLPDCRKVLISINLYSMLKNDSVSSLT